MVEHCSEFSQQRYQEAMNETLSDRNLHHKKVTVLVSEMLSEFRQGYLPRYHKL